MRNNKKGIRGQALYVALVITLIVVPLGVLLTQSAIQAMHASIMEGQQKTSAQVATDIITDYMRAFSQDPYNGHYDSASLARPASSGYYASAISSISFISNTTNHTVFLDVWGYNDSTKSHPKHIQALFQFISNLVIYGSMFNSATTLSDAGVTYTGGVT